MPPVPPTPATPRGTSGSAVLTLMRRSGSMANGFALLPKVKLAWGGGKTPTLVPLPWVIDPQEEALSEEFRARTPWEFRTRDVQQGGMGEPCPLT